MLTITKQSDYGIILLSYIYKKNNQICLSDLINETKLPQRFLARIAAKLVKEGLLKSREGKGGGYQIAERLKKISLYDYLKIFEENVMICDCGDINYQCDYEDVCCHKSVLKEKVNKIIVAQLKKVKLLQLII